MSRDVQRTHRQTEDEKHAKQDLTSTEQSPEAIDDVYRAMDLQLGQAEGLPPDSPTVRTMRQNAVMRAQQTHGNNYVQRMLAKHTSNSAQVTQSAPGQRVQRVDPATAAGVASAVFGAIGLVQNQVNTATGGLTYSSDQITYPNGLPRVGRATPINKPLAHFFSPGALIDNDTQLNLHGDFSNSSDPVNSENPPTNRFMANVYIDMESTSTYSGGTSGSTLSFAARALTTPYGTPADPKVRFVCTGRFDPVGPGDVQYRVVVEIDQFANITIIEHRFTNDSATLGFDGQFIDLGPSRGFEILV